MPRFEEACTEIGRHALRLYTSEAFLVEGVAAFAAAGLAADEGVVLVATPSHWASIGRSLQQRGFDVGALGARGQLRVLDAEATLPELLQGGGPRRPVFDALVLPLLREVRAAAPRPHVRVWGEIVNLLWERRDYDGAEQLEGHWNAALRREPFSVLCTYRACVGGLSGPLRSALRAHDRVAVEPSRLTAAAFERAVEEVLGPSQLAMLRMVVDAESPAGKVVEGDTELRMLWLQANMPRVAERVVRAAYGSEGEGYSSASHS